MNADAVLLAPLVLTAATAIAAMVVIGAYRHHALTVFVTFTGLVCALAAVPFAWSGQPGQFRMLLLLATLGAMVLVASSHFAFFFLGLELLSISLYSLIALRQNRALGIEAALKYLVLSGTSSAFLLFRHGSGVCATGDHAACGTGVGLRLLPRVHTALRPGLWLQQAQAADVPCGLGRRRRRGHPLGLLDSRRYLWLAVFTTPLPFLANELGWMAAEVGRQPWLVYNVMRTSEGVSRVVPAGHVWASLITLSVVYLLLFIIWAVFIRRAINHAPSLEEESA